MGARVGIPRALTFWEYYPMWRAFFEGLGAEVVPSGPTNRAVLDAGVKTAVDDTCLPVKLFFGHVLELRDRVDCVFIPRIVSVEKKVYTCPKFLGLPEMILNAVPGLPPVMNPTINVSRKGTDFGHALRQVGRRFTSDRRRISAAYRRAERALGSYRALVLAGVPARRAMRLAETDPGHAPGGAVGPGPGAPPVGAPAGALAGAGTPPREGLRVLLLGHPYMLNDTYINLDLVRRLEAMGAEVLTSETVPEREISRQTERLPKRLFWTFAKRTMGTALHHIEAGGVDGMIHVVPFGCGSDALVSELVERYARRAHSVPFMLLTLDEHSGEAGMITRIEAFVDMLSRRKAG